MVQRLLCSVDDELRISLTHAFYKAIWVDNEDTSNLEVIQKIANKFNIDNVESLINLEENKKKLEDNTKEAIERGAPGGNIHIY